MFSSCALAGRRGLSAALWEPASTSAEGGGGGVLDSSLRPLDSLHLPEQERSWRGAGDTVVARFPRCGVVEAEDVVKAEDEELEEEEDEELSVGPREEEEEEEEEVFGFSGVRGRLIERCAGRLEGEPVIGVKDTVEREPDRGEATEGEQEARPGEAKMERLRVAGGSMDRRLDTRVEDRITRPHTQI